MKTRSLLPLVAAVLLAGCGDGTPPPAGPGGTPSQATALPPGPEGSVLRRIQDRGKLIAGVKYDVRLFGYLDPVTNQVDGFDVAIARAIARHVLGDETKLELVEAVSKNRVPFLQEGKVDVVISTMTITEERAQQVDFSEPYYVAGQSLLVPADSAIGSLADLSGKKVATVTGSTSEKTIRARVSDAQVLLFDNYADCVQALSAGQAEAVTTDDIILQGFVRAAPGRWKLTGGQFTAEPYGIAVKKGSAELLREIDGLLRAMKADGRWKAIYEKYVDTPAPEPPLSDWRTVQPRR